MTGQAHFLRLIAALILLFGFMLGDRPLSTPDEGRYAEIPREMVETGDYLTPRLNGVKYFEKPPLLYWAEAGLIKIAGLSEFVLRLLPALLGLSGCLWLFAVTVRLADRTTAWISASILATMALYYAHARLLILDMGVSVFLSVSLFSYFMATRAFSKSLQNQWLLGFFAGAALAVMTKGVIGACLPGLIILLWTLPWQRWDALKLAFKPWGILLFLTITVPWHVWVSLKNPEFPIFYFIHEHFERFTSLAHKRYQPWWFFLPTIFVGLFPWVTFLPQAIWTHFKKAEKDLQQFLMIWILSILIFFSCSNSKLIPYILPIFPPLALLLGSYITPLWRQQKNTLGFVYGIQAFRLLCLILCIGVPIVFGFQRNLERTWILYGCVSILLLSLGGAIIGTGYFVQRGRIRATLITLTMSILILFPTLNVAWPHLDGRSIKSLALEIKKRQKPGDLIISFERYYQDLPVYLNQKIMVVGWSGELSFGMQQQDTSAWMLSHAQFWQHWNSTQPIYVLLRQSLYQSLKNKGFFDQAFVIAKTSDDVLICNF